MIPIRAERILKKLRDEESGSLSIAELENRTGFSYQKVRNLCDCLIDMGLVQRGTPKAYTSDYVVITAKGRYRLIYIFNAGTDFFARSVVVPILVSVVAAIVVMLVQSA